MSRTPRMPRAGRTPSSPTEMGSRGAPSILASVGPWRSRSAAPTARPRDARTAARLAVTALFPTPPFPLATATTAPTPARRADIRRAWPRIWARTSSASGSATSR